MKSNENNPFNSGQGDFGLPGGYFQRSAGSILNKIEWQEEHKDFPMLLHYKDASGFAVPENYFDKKEQQLELIYLARLSAIRKHNPFNVPENYFEELEVLLLSNALSDMEQELQSFKLLNAVPKQNSFETPAQYFQDNEERVKALLMPKKESRIIRLFSVKMAYVAAALLVVAFGFWAYTLYFRPVAARDCGTIACIDKVDLIKTKTLESLDNEELYELVNSKKLEEHLNTEPDKKNETIKTDSSSKSDVVDDLPDGI
jgi:hypothetical protein